MRLPIPKTSKGRLALAGALGAALLAGWLTLSRAPQGEVGLFTSLPIMWSDDGSIAAEVSGSNEPHWARATIARQGRIVPLDSLAPMPGAHAPLAGLNRLVVAQPRPFSPQENVALDAWVRAGGRLLLLADPALTETSSFALGDPRRPQPLALISPLLRHWGLELTFDESQSYGEREIEVMGVAVPVNLAGRLRTQGQSNCRAWGDGLAVTCAIGKGGVLVLADAAVLERADPGGRRANAFAWLLAAAFAGH